MLQTSVTWLIWNQGVDIVTAHQRSCQIIMFSLVSVCSQRGGVPCDQYPRCIGPHCTGPPALPLASDMGFIWGPVPTLVLTSGGRSTWWPHAFFLIICIDIQYNLNNSFSNYKNKTYGEPCSTTWVNWTSNWIWIRTLDATRNIPFVHKQPVFACALVNMSLSSSTLMWMWRSHSFWALLTAKQI